MFNHYINFYKFCQQLYDFILSFKSFVTSILVGIYFVFIYKIRFFPAVGGKVERWSRIRLFLSELWFSFYWLLTRACRWNFVHHFIDNDRLCQR
ncbi:hypothetical protein PTKIN_Ptkin02bG0142400 [Pterospermum kingtungense]